MTGALTLRVITPDRIVLDETTHSIRVPATDGELGILPRHAHMVAALDAGLVTYEKDGARQALFVSGGFLEVSDNTVRVISEAGERPADIDAERARAAQERARERLSGPRADLDVARAELALRRASWRLRAAGLGH